MAIRIGKRTCFAIAACASGLTAACMAANEPPQALAARSGGQCFLASQVNNFNAIDDDTVHVTVGVRRIFELQLFGTCPDVDWRHRIGIRSTGGGSWVCRGHEAELLVPSGMGVQRCAVSSVRQLTPAEVEAWRARRGS